MQVQRGHEVATIGFKAQYLTLEAEFAAQMTATINTLEAKFARFRDVKEDEMTATKCRAAQAKAKPPCQTHTTHHSPHIHTHMHTHTHTHTN